MLSPMRDLRWPLSLLALVTFWACRSGESAKYAGAGVTAGLAVAGAAINRAATDECWGNCSPGFGCDDKSGKCVPLDELEEAPKRDWSDDEDDGCIVEDDGRRVCPDDPEPVAEAGAGGAGGDDGDEGGVAGLGGVPGAELQNDRP